MGLRGRRAQWVDSGYDRTLLPEQFDNVKQAREWLPLGWHPATFDLEATRIAVREVLESEDDE